MALDATTLAELAFTKYASKMQTQHPEVVKARTTAQETRADGTTALVFTDETGPLEVRREDIMPLLSALAEAIVEHMNEHAEVQNVANGTQIRNIT